MNQITVGAWLILATQGLALVGAAVGIIQSLRNRKAIQEVHFLVNSRLTELLTITKASSHAEGRLEGIGAAVTAQKEMDK